MREIDFLVWELKKYIREMNYSKTSCPEWWGDSEDRHLCFMERVLKCLEGVQANDKK